MTYYPFHIYIDFVYEFLTKRFIHSWWSNHLLEFVLLRLNFYCAISIFIFILGQSENYMLFVFYLLFTFIYCLNLYIFGFFGLDLYLTFQQRFIIYFGSCTKKQLKFLTCLALLHKISSYQGNSPALLFFLVVGVTGLWVISTLGLEKVQATKRPKYLNVFDVQPKYLNSYSIRLYFKNYSIDASSQLRVRWKRKLPNFKWSMGYFSRHSLNFYYTFWSFGLNASTKSFTSFETFVNTVRILLHYDIKFTTKLYFAFGLFHDFRHRLDVHTLIYKIEMKIYDWYLNNSHYAKGLESTHFTIKRRSWLRLYELLRKKVKKDIYYEMASVRTEYVHFYLAKRLRDRWTQKWLNRLKVHRPDLFVISNRYPKTSRAYPDGSLVTGKYKEIATVHLLKDHKIWRKTFFHAGWKFDFSQHYAKTLDRHIFPSPYWQYKRKRGYLAPSFSAMYFEKSYKDRASLDSQKLWSDKTRFTWPELSNERRREFRLNWKRRPLIRPEDRSDIFGWKIIYSWDLLDDLIYPEKRPNFNHLPYFIRQRTFWSNVYKRDKYNTMLVELRNMPRYNQLFLFQNRPWLFIKPGYAWYFYLNQYRSWSSRFTYHSFGYHYVIVVIRYTFGYVVPNPAWPIALYPEEREHKTYIPEKVDAHYFFFGDRKKVQANPVAECYFDIKGSNLSRLKEFGECTDRVGLWYGFSGVSGLGYKHHFHPEYVWRTPICEERNWDVSNHVWELLTEKEKRVKY